MREPEYFLGKPVQSLQTMLRHIADADPRVLPLIPDGYYGPNTYASVLSFQQAYGLPETGQVDPETWDRIVAVHDMVFPNRVPPVTSPIWPAGQVIEPDSPTTTCIWSRPCSPSWHSSSRPSRRRQSTVFWTRPQPPDFDGCSAPAACRKPAL